MENNNFYTVRGYEIMYKGKNLLSNSMEDYLEMIYRSTMDGSVLHVNELAESLNVKAPSATKMVQRLGGLGLLKYEKYGTVELTEEGMKVGEFLLKRHEIIEEFLKNIGVEKKLLVNVELIEHNVTQSALDRIEKLNNFFRAHPEVLKMFNEFCDS